GLGIGAERGRTGLVPGSTRTGSPSGPETALALAAGPLLVLPPCWSPQRAAINTSSRGRLPGVVAGRSGQAAACVTGTATGRSAGSEFWSLPACRKDSDCPAKPVLWRIVPCWNGPAPSTQVSLAVLLASITPDCH